MERIGEGNFRWLPEFMREHNIPAHGVLHIGGHKGEEVPTYIECGFAHIVVVEPDPKLAAHIVQKYGNSPGYFVVDQCAAVSADSTASAQIPFYVADRSFGSSTDKNVMLDNIIAEILVPAAPITYLQMKYFHNVLVIDTQGTEEEILKSAFLNNLDLVIVETGDPGTGVPACDFDRAIEIMDGNGFELSERWRHGHHPYSDSLFTRSNQ